MAGTAEVGDWAVVEEREAAGGRVGERVGEGEADEGARRLTFGRMDGGSAQWRLLSVACGGRRALSLVSHSLLLQLGGCDGR